MPMNRYEVRNEYSLADPELYKAADKDDPEALLEGVAMAGLVGVLRQLGDLAEFAAEIFHDLHEEVMVTAARGHTLMSRVQQLESEFPPIEKAFLSQISHSTFFSNSGTEWHPNMQMNQNLITKGDLPRFVMDSYEEARGPPRLFLLDKFDIAGAGSCLKRYTDPSFYKVEASFLDMASVDVQRDKRIRKAKKKGPRWKHGETPEILPSIKLHQLFLEERVESGASDPARLVKLKRKSSASSFGSENGKSYMEKFLKTQTLDKIVHEVSVGSSPLMLPSKNTTGSGHEIQIRDVSNVGPNEESVQPSRGPYPPPSLGINIVSPSENDFIEEKTSVGPTLKNHSFDDKDVVVDDGEIKVEERESNGSDYDDASEIDSYMDALATMESEVETENEFRPKKKDVGFLNIEKHMTESDSTDEHLLSQSQSQSQFSDSQSVGNFSASDDGNSSIRKGVSSFSCSDDTASTSAEETPSPSNQDLIIEQSEIHAEQSSLSSPVDQEAIFVEGDKSRELEPSDASSDASEILSDPTKTEEQQIDDKSEILCGPTETKERATEESGEISSGLTEIKEQPTDNNGENSDGLTEMEELPENVGDILERQDEVNPRSSYEEHLKDEAELEDSYVDSCTVIDKANILEEIHEKEGSEKSLQDVIQTKLVEKNVSARNSVDTSPESVISHPEEQPSILHLEGVAGNSHDDRSDKFDSAEIGIDGIRDGKLSRDSESDVEEDGNESDMNLMTSEFLSHVSEYRDRPSLSDIYSQSDGREDKIVHSDRDVEENRIESDMNPMASDFLSHVSEYQDRSSLEDNCSQSDVREDDEIVHAEDEVEKACKSSLPEDPAGGSEFTSQLETSQTDSVESNETDRESWSGPTSGEVSVSERPQMSNHTFDLSQKVNAPLNPASDFPGFNLLPGGAQLILEEVPPLPPLPPVQWRIGKIQHSSVPLGGDDGQQVNHFPPIFPSIPNENMRASNPFLLLPPLNVEDSRHRDLMGNMVNSTPFLLQMPTPNLAKSLDDFVDFKETQSSNPFGAVSATHSERLNHEEESAVLQPTIDHSGSCNDHLTLGQSQPSNLFEAESAPSDEKPQHAEEEKMIQSTVDHSDDRFDFIASSQTQSSTVNRLPEHVEPTTEEVCSTSTSELPSVDDEKSTALPSVDDEKSTALPSVDNEKSTALPSIDNEKSNGNQIPKFLKPRSPLIDAVAAHDKSKLRKVTERVRPQEQKVEERDSMLEQIRMKSFNLKPAVATRPTIHGPRTNLRVAAILEKANAIRQAFAGSDDDDDDSWSDS